MPLPTTLIIGAGPTGLTLAIELARQNLPFRIIDKSPSPAQFSQALVVQARTLEQFEHCADPAPHNHHAPDSSEHSTLASRAVAAGHPITRATFTADQHPLLSLDLSRIPGRYPFVLLLPQSTTERLLTQHLFSLGHRIERGIELLSVDANLPDSVHVTLRRPDGHLERTEARWLVGCDGAHSAVRHALNLPFEGDAVPLSFLLGDLDLTGTNLPPDEISLHLQSGDILFLARLAGDTWRVILVEHNRDWTDSQPTSADFQRALDRMLGPGIRVGAAHWISPYHVHQRKTPHYRIASTFLAGDACHIHSPVAGQGMNTGIQDAANLAWKLAAVTRDRAPDSLLDTYDRERGLVGDRLLRRTSLGLAAAATTNPFLRRFRNTLARSANHLESIQTRLLAFISETDIHYPRSSIAIDHGGGDSHLLPGHRVPNPPLPTGGRLLDPLSTGKHLAILPPNISIPDFLRPFACITQLSPTTPELQYLLGTQNQSFLIRPDGYLGLRAPSHHTPALHAYTHFAGLP